LFRRSWSPSLWLSAAGAGNRYRSDRAIRSPRSQSCRNSRRASSSESQPASAAAVANPFRRQRFALALAGLDRVDAIGALFDHRETGSGSDQQKRTVLNSFDSLTAVIIHTGAPQSLYLSNTASGATVSLDLLHRVIALGL